MLEAETEKSEMNVIIYDHEIKKAILGKGEEPIPGIEYCDGWRDFSGMGISVTGAYDYLEDRYRLFADDNRDELQALINRADLVIGFNNIAFDDELSRAHGVEVPVDKSFDLLVEIWRAAGLGPEFNSTTHKNFGLDACCQANFGMGKSGNGALAPVLWQQGRFGEVVDYCLNDIRLTKALVDKVIKSGYLCDPRDPTHLLDLPESIVPAMAG